LISGDLTVDGNVTYINITDLNVQDPIIGIGRGANNAPLTVNDGKDRGEQLWYYGTQENSAFIGYQNSTGNLIAASNVSIANEIVTVNSYGTFVAGNVAGSSLSVTGNVTGNYFIGNGSQLTGISTSSNANLAVLTRDDGVVYFPITSGFLILLTRAGNVSIPLAA
jgi:hypothetical protein